MSALPALLPPTMSPGTYLRLRREAEGLTIGTVARLAVRDGIGLPAVITALSDAEADHALLGDADLVRLAPVLFLDPAVYDRLVDGEPAYAICRGCGATRNCTWVNRDQTFCTACLASRA